MDWMKLKSGSDVRGVAVSENAPLTEHVAMCLGMAFALCGEACRQAGDAGDDCHWA